MSKTFYTKIDFNALRRLPDVLGDHWIVSKVERFGYSSSYYDTADITTRPPRTNSSDEICDEGWLGSWEAHNTYTSRYSHGKYNSYYEAIDALEIMYKYWLKENNAYNKRQANQGG